MSAHVGQETHPINNATAHPREKPHRDSLGALRYAQRRSRHHRKHRLSPHRHKIIFRPIRRLPLPNANDERRTFALDAGEDGIRRGFSVYVCAPHSARAGDALPPTAYQQEAAMTLTRSWRAGAADQAGREPFRNAGGVDSRGHDGPKPRTHHPIFSQALPSRGCSMRSTDIPDCLLPITMALVMWIRGASAANRFPTRRPRGNGASTRERSALRQDYFDPLPADRAAAARRASPPRS